MSQPQLTAACEVHRSQIHHLLLQMRASKIQYRDHLLSRDKFVCNGIRLCGQFIAEAEAIFLLIDEYTPEPDLSDCPRCE